MITIERYAYTDQGTFGVLTFGDFTCFTVERPWLNNQAKVSCIPEGDYTAIAYNSPKFGSVFAITGGTVSLYPDSTHARSAVLIHPANTMDDLEGCVGLGSDHGTINGVPGVINSRVTIAKFYELLAGQTSVSLSITFKKTDGTA